MYVRFATRDGFAWSHHHTVKTVRSGETNFVKNLYFDFNFEDCNETFQHYFTCTKRLGEY